MAFLTQRTEPETEKGLVSSSQIVDGEGVVVVVAVRTMPVSSAYTLPSFDPT